MAKALPFGPWWARAYRPATQPHQIVALIRSDEGGTSVMLSALDLQEADELAKMLEALARGVRYSARIIAGEQAAVAAAAAAGGAGTAGDTTYAGVEAGTTAAASSAAAEAHDD